MPRGASLLFSSREEEIAKLEAQLRQLRDEEGLTESKDMEEKLAAKENEISRRLEKMKGKEMLLSEQELISGGLVEVADSNVVDSRFGVIVAVAAVVFLLLFAQVPVGQEDLSRYSATGSSSVKTIDLGDLNPNASGL